MTTAANRLPARGREQKRSRRIPAEKARATGTSGARQTLSASGARRNRVALPVGTRGAVVAADMAGPPDSWRAKALAPLSPAGRGEKNDPLAKGCQRNS